RLATPPHRVYRPRIGPWCAGLRGRFDEPVPGRGRRPMEADSERPGGAHAGTRTLEELTRPMLATLQAMTGYDSVYLTTIDAAAGLQHILFSTNARQMRIPEGLSVPWSDTLCKRALESGEMATCDVRA